MGSDLGKETVILDFFGVPGSGKTTKSHEIAESYRRKGKLVVEPSYDLDHCRSSWKRKISKLLMTDGLFAVENSAYKDARSLVEKNGYNSTNGKSNQIVNIATKLYSIKKYSGKQTTSFLMKGWHRRRFPFRSIVLFLPTRIFEHCWL